MLIGLTLIYTAREMVRIWENRKKSEVIKLYNVNVKIAHTYLYVIEIYYVCFKMKLLYYYGIYKIAVVYVHTHT